MKSLITLLFLLLTIACFSQIQEQMIDAILHNPDSIDIMYQGKPGTVQDYRITPDGHLQVIILFRDNTIIEVENKCIDWRNVGRVAMSIPIRIVA